MITIWIRWYCGYAAYISSVTYTKYLSLASGEMYFYDAKGNVVRCGLTDSVQFDMNLNCEFNIRKEIDFTCNEVFAIKHKEKNGYALYIPMSEVKFTKLGIAREESYDGLGNNVYRCYCFKATNLNFWNNVCNSRIFKVKDDMVFFKNYIGYESNDKGNMVLKIQTLIRNTCDVHIEKTDLVKMLEHFVIIKKRDKINII